MIEVNRLIANLFTNKFQNIETKYQFFVFF